jgi:hypothetical protein
VGSLSPDVQELLNVNIGEWLLTDAKIAVQGEQKPVREILLSHDDFPLTPEESAGFQTWGTSVERI